MFNKFKIEPYDRKIFILDNEITINFNSTIE